MEKNKDLGLKLGSDDMVFWQQIIDAREIDIQNTKNNLRYYKAILEMAQKNCDEAEKEFDKSQ